MTVRKTFVPWHIELWTAWWNRTPTWAPGTLKHGVFERKFTVSSPGTEDSSHLAEKADTRHDFSNFMRLINTSNSPPSMEASPDSAKQFITGRFSAPCHQLVMVKAAYITPPSPGWFTSSHDHKLSSRGAPRLSALHSVLRGHATKSVCYPWGHMPSARQENAPPATIQRNTNLELLKHQSENE